VAKRRYLSNLSEEFPGHDRQRYRRSARRHLAPRLSAKARRDAIWLTPFYVSPQVDNGYDVANYTAIDPPTARWMISTSWCQAKARGIRIVLDMVLNHTSTEHAWFRESLNKESPYRQFYIWRDGEPTTPPNNWRSKFGGNAWQWHAESEQYYLHLFAAEQADLNWENPAVRAS
jgi:trehalose-6-phosphate hydrolase